MTIKPYANIKLKGYNIRRFINLCTINQIKIWSLKYISQDEYDACCMAEDIFLMKPHLKKTHTKILQIKKKGFFTIVNFLDKIRIITAMLACTFLIYMLLSMRIWSIDVNGNSFINSVTIVDFIKKKGIVQGCMKEKEYSWLENELEKNYPDITWCSVYLSGSTLNIDMSEGINLGE